MNLTDNENNAREEREERRRECEPETFALIVHAEFHGNSGNYTIELSLRQCKCNIFQINLTRLQYCDEREEDMEGSVEDKKSVICFYRKRELDIYACAASERWVSMFLFRAS